MNFRTKFNQWQQTKCLPDPVKCLAGQSPTLPQLLQQRALGLPISAIKQIPENIEGVVSPNYSPLSGAERIAHYSQLATAIKQHEEEINTPTPPTHEELSEERSD